MTTPLEGDALKARVAELRPAPETDLATACGYVNAAGKANVAAFTKALSYAHGLIDAPTKAPRASGGRGLGFSISAGKTTGNLVLSAGYAELIGVKPGETVEIKHVGNSLVLHPAGVVPVFRDEPVPSLPTYDSVAAVA
jgi:hypothetical protein